VRPGMPFMQVVDPDVMEVRVPVNQEDLLSLKMGKSAGAPGCVHRPGVAGEIGIDRSDGHAE